MRRGKRTTLLVLACLLAGSALAGVAWAAFSATATNSGNTLSASSSFPRCYGDAVLADNPTQYWRLDETSGTTATESIGGANGTYMNGAAPGQSGAFAETKNKAASFDGVDDWVDIPDQSFSGDFSAEFWVNLDTPGTGGSSNGNKDAAFGQEATGVGPDINFAGSKARLYTGSSDAIIADEAVHANTWEHYVITRSGTTVRLYRNGVENAATGTWSGTFNPKALGRGAGGFLDGKLDDVALYSTALSAARVRAHYNAGRCVRDEPLADNPRAFWRLGDPAGSALAFDAVGNNYGMASSGVTFNQASGLDGDTGTSADFDGATSWIGTPDVGSSVDFTLQGWTYLTDPNQNSGQNFNNAVYGTGSKIRLLVRPSGFYAGAYPGGGAEYAVQGNLSTNANINTWVHWAVVRSGATMTVYRNGLPVGSRSDLPATTAVTLGGELGRYGGQYYLKGRIDDVAVYDSALSAQRVRAQYIAGRAYRDVVLADGPQAYWRLGETSGTTAADAAGTSTATYTNSPGLNKPGAVAGDADRSVTFDGTNDYAITAGTLPWNLGAYSYETWIKGTDYSVPFSNNQSVMSDQNGQSGRYFYFFGNQFIFGVYDNGVGYKSVAAPTPSVNAWHHVVGTWDGDKTLTLYVDGVQAGQFVSSTTIVPVATTARYNLGRHPAGTNYFNGSLDETAVYTKALTADQVKLHYEAGLDAPR